MNESTSIINDRFSDITGSSENSVDYLHPAPRTQVSPEMRNRREEAVRYLSLIFRYSPTDSKIIINTSRGQGFQTKEFALDEDQVFERIGQ